MEVERKYRSDHQLHRMKVMLWILISAVIILFGAVLAGWFVLQQRSANLNHVEVNMDILRTQVNELLRQQSTSSTSREKRDLKEGNKNVSHTRNTLPMCYLCAPGKDGKDGKDGRDGQDGEDGRDGRDALGLAEIGILINKTVYDISSKIEAPPTPHVNSTGAVYIRWGRSTCPATSTLLYKGETAGAHYQHSGGGSNYQCLPDNPEYLRHSDSVDTQAYIYGAEYQTQSGYSAFRTTNINNQNVPCAACLANGRNSKIMIPGKITCPDNTWTAEYQGFIMTEKWDHKGRTTYECVDEDAESIPGGSGNEDGALFSFVQSFCSEGVGSGRLINCPPYVHGRELSCVVCSK